MTLTRSFKQLVQIRVANDPAFGAALLREGIDTMLAGDEATGTQPKSLIRMFGSRGNPQARNLFGVICYLQKQAGVQLHVMPGPN